MEERKFEVVASIPDTVGYLCEEAKYLLKRAGYTIRLTPGHLSFVGRLRVIRQRLVGEKTIELTLASEKYADPSF